MSDNRRQNNRVGANLPIEIYVDSQVTIQGRVKDLSSKSAFIQMKSSVYMQLNDELNFLIKLSQGAENDVGGVGRISRIAPGEGIAIYFTQMDEAGTSRLQQLIR